MRRGALRTFLQDCSGNTAITAAIALPALMAAVAVAIEMSQVNTYQSKLQAVADGAAIAAARELRLGNATPQTIIGVASANVASNAGSLQINYNFAAEVSSDKRSITVNLTASPPAGLGAAAGLVTPEIRASATARVMGGAPVCAVGLNESASGTISLEKQAQVQAPGCSVYSNSKSSTGIELRDTSLLTSAFTCSAGGYNGTGSFSPTPDRDCPVFPDPLASRPAPLSNACPGGSQKPLLISTDTFLTPGTYCGGINIQGGSQVRLQPGIYAIKDGPLTIGQSSTLTGTDVGLYFSGALATMDMKRDSSISLTAPKSGEMAGLLIYQDRTVSSSKLKFEISSDDASVLLGTIYLPRGQLYVGGTKPVAQKSAYTIIVADQISGSAGPTLVLNSNYSASDVPVPKGLGPLTSTIGLQK